MTAQRHAQPPAPPTPSTPVADQPRGGAYDLGIQAGRQAAQSVPTPLTNDQVTWLTGFISGLLSDSGGLQRNPATPSTSLRPTTTVGPDFAARPHTPFEPAPVPQVAPSNTLPTDKYDYDNPYAARVLGVTPVGAPAMRSWQLTLDIEGSGMSCSPGDLLGVFPGNDPDLVRHLLRLLGARGQENVTTPRGSAPAWRALLEELDLTSITRALLWSLSACARSSQDAARLSAMVANREPIPNTVLELLQGFPSARPSLAEFVASLGPLAPEYVPIAASCSAQSESLEALVSVPVAETPHAGSLFHTAVSGQLKAGEWLSIYVHRQEAGRPPSDPDTPVILLALGSACACARAFLQDRKDTGARGRNWLFVSTPETQSEPFFATQLAAWQASRLLTRMDVSPPGVERLVECLQAQLDMLERWLVDESLLYVFADHSRLPELLGSLGELLRQRSSLAFPNAENWLTAMQDTGRLRLIPV